MKALKKISFGKSKGVAILMVLVALALLMAVVTEISLKETVRYKLAINERDLLQAEGLAKSGANFAQLILMVQEPLQGYLTNFANMGINLPAYTIWNLLPLDSNLLTNFSNGDLFGSSEKKDQAEKEKKVNFFGPYEAPEGGYGGFLGSFSMTITDEESKISLRKWVSPATTPPQKKAIADQIIYILSQNKYKKFFDGSFKNSQVVNPSQLVGFIYDYMTEGEIAVDVNAQSANWGREGHINKKTYYIDMDGILPKRARLDTLSELRLLPLMNDAIYSILDKYLSIYAETQAVNILSVSDEVLKSIFYMCAKNRESALAQDLTDNLLNEWNKKKGEGQVQLSAEGILKFLQSSNIEVDKEECNKIAGTESKNFTIKSVATVGNVTKTLVVRLRSAGGTSTIYQFQYL